MNARQKKLCERIDYQFQKDSLLTLALTHASAGKTNNERLEFLGDAILEFVCSELLYQKLPSADEGFLTKKRAQLVCESSLASWARSIDLGSCLIFGKSAKNTSIIDNHAVLCDAVEALLGAIYLDGGMAAVRPVILNMLTFLSIAESHTDYKTQLQELLQQQGEKNITYQLLSTKGPAHKPEFTTSVRCNEVTLGVGIGFSKKEAEQQAAKQALHRLQK